MPAKPRKTSIRTDSGFRREVVFDVTGSYVLLNLPVGPYWPRSVALRGIRAVAQTSIALRVNSTPVIPLQLGHAAG